MYLLKLKNPSQPKSTSSYTQLQIQHNIQSFKKWKPHPKPTFLDEKCSFWNLKSQLQPNSTPDSTQILTQPQFF